MSHCGKLSYRRHLQLTLDSAHHGRVTQIRGRSMLHILATTEMGFDTIGVH